MSDETSTDNVHATDEPTVTTDNVHATTEPLNGKNLIASDEETGEATTDNVHATDEPV
jgi:head-tail adaptor